MGKLMEKDNCKGINSRSRLRRIKDKTVYEVLVQICKQVAYIHVRVTMKSAIVIHLLIIVAITLLFHHATNPYSLDKKHLSRPFGRARQRFASNNRTNWAGRD